MLWGASAIDGFTVEGSDGPLGTIRDLLFEEDGWAARWLAIEAGEWLRGRKVLLPHAALGCPDRSQRRLRVALTRRQIRTCPDIDPRIRVSRQMEAEVYDHYGCDPYWDDDSFEATSGLTRLRSVAAVRGYHIHASDGEIGRVEDCLVDDAGWSIRYIAAKVRWWPKQSVLLSPRSALAIDWDNGKFYLNVTACPPRQEARLGGYSM